MKLFVDCDDTLIKWKDSVNGKPGTSFIYTPNWELIGVLKMWKIRNPRDLIIVWSGGGKEYAGGWARSYLGSVYDSYHAKDPELSGPEDILIDDQVLAFAGKLMTAEQFVEKYK